MFLLSSPSTLSTAEMESLKVQTWAEQGHSVWGREGLCLLVSNLIRNLYATLKYAISTPPVFFSQIFLKTKGEKSQKTEKTTFSYSNEIFFH